MRSRTSRIIATVILVMCIVCPLVDLFDNWDHAMQTGNETEYALLVLALCVGLAYLLARFILTFPLFRSAIDLVSQLSASKLVPFALRGSFFVSPIPLSPLALALRI
jgi:ABC-type amino acid transport system permease subunit